MPNGQIQRHTHFRIRLHPGNRTGYCTRFCRTGVPCRGSRPDRSEIAPSSWRGWSQHSGLGDLSTGGGAEDVLNQLGQVGEVDVLVNNAGIFSVEDFFELADDEWERYYQTNVMSLVRLCRALMPGMLERNRGSIINVSSEAAIKPLPQMIHYSMTKTAMLSISRGLAELTKGTAVRVNSLLPGPTWTGGVESYFEGLAEQEGRPLEEILSGYFQEHEPTSLIQRFAQVNEVADAAVFLAKNGAVNGSSLRVEGGIIRAI